MPVPEDESFSVNEMSVSSISQFYKPIRMELEQVCEIISQQLQSSEHVVQTCLQRLDQRQGKMLRPALTLLCGKLFSSIDSAHFRCAAMMELVHMASLLHDDVIDQADLRRGSASVNALWGNTAAVLLGDFLLTKAFALGTENNNALALEKLIRTAQALCEGELTQNLCRNSFETAEDEYLGIIEKKTAVLFSCCCGLGAIASGASEEQVKSIEQFGLNFGLAFQIKDDLKDLLSNTDVEGKPLGADIPNGTLTLPVIHWIHQDPNHKKQLMEFANTTQSHEAFAASLRSSGSIQYALEKGAAFSETAKRSLNIFDESPAKNALLMISEYIVSSL